MSAHTLMLTRASNRLGSIRSLNPFDCNSPRDSHRNFGPRAAPLYYTGIHSPLSRIAWEPAPVERAYQVTISHLQKEQAPRTLVRTVVSDCACSLRSLPLRPDSLYEWRVELIGSPADVTKDTGKSAAAEPYIEGRFWTLDQSTIARWQRSLHLFEPMADVELRRLAFALLMAEVGLYHDAIRQIRQAPRASDRPGRTALSHTTQALIYRQMGIRIEKERARCDGNEPPERFADWTTAREQYHRRQATGQAAKSGSFTPEEPFAMAAVGPASAARRRAA